MIQRAFDCAECERIVWYVNWLRCLVSVLALIVAGGILL